MPVTAQSTIADLTGREKAAILLITLGPEKSAQIFKHLKESEIESESRKPIDDFFTALNARDIERGRRTLHYPHIQIAGCDVSILESPADFEINFQALADSGWTYSTLDSCTMRHFCDEKVHFELQLSMHKANDSRYATYQALWIVTRRNDVWGIQCRSIFPSGSRLT